MKKLAWATTRKTVNELIPQDVNPRTITDKQMSDIQKSLKKFNLVEIPAVDADGKILAGHQRIKALQLLGRGDEEIDVRVPNRKLTQKESEQYLIASNKLGGDWDTDLLKHFDFDMLSDSGFEDMELMEFWDQEDKVTGDDFDVEKELSKIKNPKTKLGDIILLGKSKVICGDSTSEEVVRKVCGTDKVSMIFSDPIYNISYSYSKGLGKKQKYDAEVHDTRSFDEYKEFITKSIKASLAVSYKDVHVFYWCSQVYIGLIQDVYRNLDIDNKGVALWLKNGFTPLPNSIFNRSYEPAVFGSRGKPFLNKVRTKYHDVMNTDVGNGNEIIENVDHLFDVWAQKRLSGKEMEHATSKPPETYERAMLRCTKVNDIIFDSFLGSGSSIIAAEQLGRRVYGCELEPAYCDLIIRRYEKLKGIKAIVEHA
jgi:DNA modification methylase